MEILGSNTRQDSPVSPKYTIKIGNSESNETSIGKMLEEYDCRNSLELGSWKIGFQLPSECARILLSSFTV